MVEKKLVLDLCGGTGAWSKPYRNDGYDVRLITLPEHDVRLYQPPEDVYGVLAAPPCTHLGISGARWWKEKGQEALFEALAIVDACMRIILIAKPKFWALENPVGRLVNYLGKPKMYFQPYEYGDPWSKKTCLWGNFNVPKMDAVLCLDKNRINYMPPRPDRALRRGITPSGFAKAFFEANK